MTPAAGTVPFVRRIADRASFSYHAILHTGGAPDVRARAIRRDRPPVRVDPQ